MKQDATRFSICEGLLCIDGKPIGDDPHSHGFNHLRFNRQLGSGASGTVFSAENEVIKVEQAVKVYLDEPDMSEKSEKPSLEAIKNANRALSRWIASVNDAGAYEYPVPISYSVMEMIPSAQTLGSWLKERNEVNGEINSTYRKQSPDREFTLRLMAQSVDVAAGLLNPVLGLHHASVIHGDLNLGNIMLLSSEQSPAGNSLASLSQLRPGSSQQVCVRLIDLGTSQLKQTSKEYGNMREVNCLMEDFKKILKPITLNLQTSFKNWFNLEEINSGIDVSEKCWHEKGVQGSDSVNAIEVSGDLYRLTAFLTLLIGYMWNYEKGSTEQFDAREISDFSSIMSGRRMNEMGCFDAGFLSTWDNVDHSSKGKLIDWGNVISDACKYYPPLGQYEISYDDEGPYFSFRR